MEESIMNSPNLATPTPAIDDVLCCFSEIVIDWATSVVAMGRVQQLAREGKQLPPCATVD